MTEINVLQLALLGEAAECLTDVSVFVWDDDRNYLAVNQAACRLLERTRDEILAMRVGDMHPDRAADIFEQVQKRGVHSGSMSTPRGELQFVTSRTKIAGLPYMISICWQSAAS